MYASIGFNKGALKNMPATVNHALFVGPANFTHVISMKPSYLPAMVDCLVEASAAMLHVTSP